MNPITKNANKRFVNVHDFAQYNDSLPSSNKSGSGSFRPYNISLPQTPPQFKSLSPPSKLLQPSSLSDNLKSDTVMSADSKSVKYGSPQGKLPGSLNLSPSADHFLTAAKSQTSKVLGSASPLENTGHSAQPLSYGTIFLRIICMTIQFYFSSTKLIKHLSNRTKAGIEYQA